MKALREYGFSDQVSNLVAPVIRSLEQGQRAQAEIELAALALQALDWIAEQRLSPVTADEAFTLLDVYLSDHRELPELSADAYDLLMEGAYLHHYGERWGPRADNIRALANKLQAHGAAASTATGASMSKQSVHVEKASPPPYEVQRWHVTALLTYGNGWGWRHNTNKFRHEFVDVFGKVIAWLDDWIVYSGGDWVTPSESGQERMREFLRRYLRDTGILPLAPEPEWRQTEYTAREAANFLFLRDSVLHDLLESGEIPSHWRAGQRWVWVEDLRDYYWRDYRQQRQAILAERAAEAQEMGFYEEGKRKE